MTPEPKGGVGFPLVSAQDTPTRTAVQDQLRLLNELKDMVRCQVCRSCRLLPPFSHISFSKFSTFSHTLTWGARQTAPLGL